MFYPLMWRGDHGTECGGSIEGRKTMGGKDFNVDT
jgi:hypothetical protein